MNPIFPHWSFEAPTQTLRAFTTLFHGQITVLKLVFFSIRESEYQFTVTF